MEVIITIGDYAHAVNYLRVNCNSMQQTELRDTGKATKVARGILKRRTYMPVNCNELLNVTYNTSTDITIGSEE